MHFESSSELFSKYNKVVEKPLIFVDFGCGPLTGGIALQNHFSDPSFHLHYVGIDISNEMISKAKEFQNYQELFNPVNQHFEWLNDYIQLPEILLPLMQHLKEYSLIFNFSYFFASHSVDPQIVFATTQQILQSLGDNTFWVLYQNPTAWSLHEKWTVYRNLLLQNLFVNKALISNPFPYGYQDIFAEKPLNLYTTCEILRRN
ncbi:MAG: class I SAM-dependent methyltransferase [Sphingobacteriales bacterium JAD_PAG50586_3]|nr:MAG: class I SAM-dependent methyltransferase [Sphingobacteriales bacterium JAD_PAG50586_3]